MAWVHNLVTKKVLIEALRLCKYSAGKLPGSIAKTNEFDIKMMSLEIRFTVHRQSCTSTKLLTHLWSDSLPFPWMNLGNALLQQHGNPYQWQKWKYVCLYGIKHPTKQEVASICCVKRYLNSQYNSCMRVWKTLTLAVYICTVCCHLLKNCIFTYMLGH